MVKEVGTLYKQGLACGGYASLHSVRYGNVDFSLPCVAKPRPAPTKTPPAARFRGETARNGGGQRG